MYAKCFYYLKNETKVLLFSTEILFYFKMVLRWLITEIRSWIEVSGYLPEETNFS